MRAHSVVLALALAVVLGGSALGASAFTTASVDRGASIDVVGDSDAIVGLDPGPQSATGGIVELDGSGALAIDFSVNAATGVNPSATYRLGAQTPGDPPGEVAFNVTNRDARSHDLTLDYALTADDGNSAANVEFRVYDGSGSQVGVVTEESGSLTLSGVGSGVTRHVVLVVDTTGLGQSVDLSGTLTVTAS
jgi:hypothetical protein